MKNLLRTLMNGSAPRAGISAYAKEAPLVSKKTLLQAQARTILFPPFLPLSLSLYLSRSFPLSFDPQIDANRTKIHFADGKKLFRVVERYVRGTGGYTCGAGQRIGTEAQRGTV